jgi:predicted nucleotidyltransferase
MMDDILKNKVDNALELWKRFWGDELKSAYLFGSAARGSWSKKSSDINILLVLEKSNYDKWPDATEIAKRRLKKGFALPLVFTEGYVKSSLDVYPIEFLDMKLFHKTLHGEDIFSNMEIDLDHLRLQAEREVKGKWVQLRQAALERGGNTAAMRDLLSMTVPTWVSVFQALITINGEEVSSDTNDVIIKGTEIASLDKDVFLNLKQLRSEQQSMNRTAAWNLLKSTLEQVDQLAKFVDSWEVK